ncbi:MAG TPA: hypothetical protein VOA87_13445 [Thermoanaerobaculia bacterium]|nr:hypothetical protein [Thermoanaerobaculia bacterium]
MPLYRIRHLSFVTIVMVSVVWIGAIWRGSAVIYNPLGHDDSHLDAVLATAIQTTSSVGGVALALIFITAQLSSSKSSVLRELYRSSEVYVLLFYFAGTLLVGYLAFAALPTPQSATALKIVDTVLTFALTSVVLVIPVLILQIENINPTILAAKLADRIKPKSLIDYGLTQVEFMPGDPTQIQYRLITVALRPREVDPLRPIHEVLMEAVRARDRVLFGKLFRHFLKPIARVHGATWDLSGLRVQGNADTSLIRTLLSRRYGARERVHLTLAILHYSVKRARNLKAEWEGRDTGRHGILTGMGDLIRCLNPVQGAGTSIRIALYATLHISEYYADVRPFGRIEPLNYYFETANQLWVAKKTREAELCAEILAWITIHTDQLKEERSPSLYNSLPGDLKSVFFVAQERARSDAKWLPGFEDEDPWRRWLE